MMKILLKCMCYFFRSVESSRALLLIVLLSLCTTGRVKSQKLCANASKKEIPANNIIFVENFSATKCMKMEGFGILPDSKVVLGECLYRTTSSKDQQLQHLLNPMNKTTFRQDAGRGEHYCLTIPTSSSDPSLKNTLCNTQKLDQSWTLKPVQGQPGQFLIEQFSSKKCLKPKSRASGSVIQLATCNAHETEQIWKIFYSNPAANITSTVILCSK